MYGYVLSGGLFRFYTRTYGYDSNCVFNCFIFLIRLSGMAAFLWMAFLCTVHLVSALYNEDE